MNKFEQPMTTHRIGTEGRGSLENFRARRRAFRALHEAGCFVIPNPWDVGSARYLQQLGFPAVATTSAGFAFSQGLPDRRLCNEPRNRDEPCFHRDSLLPNSTSYPQSPRAV